MDFEDEALHLWIVARIKSIQNRLLQATRPDNTLALQNNLTEALGKIEVLQQEEKNLRRIIQELRSDNQQLSIHLNAIQQVQRTITPTPETQADSIPRFQTGGCTEDSKGTGLDAGLAIRANV